MFLVGQVLYCVWPLEGRLEDRWTGNERERGPLAPTPSPNIFSAITFMSPAVTRRIIVYHPDDIARGNEEGTRIEDAWPGGRLSFCTVVALTPLPSIPSETGSAPIILLPSLPITSHSKGVLWLSLGTSAFVRHRGSLVLPGESALTPRSK